MNGWEKAFAEYVETGRVSACPNCGMNDVETEGYISGKRGSVTIKCPSCNEQRHYDGFSSMHDKAPAETVIRFR